MSTWVQGTVPSWRLTDDHQLEVVEVPAMIWHLDGVPYWDAPLPRWLHRCRAQTRGMGVERCACGAIKEGIGIGGFWLERNQTRRSRPGWWLPRPWRRA